MTMFERRTPEERAAALARLAGGIALERPLIPFSDFAVDPARGSYAPGPFVRRYESLPFHSRGAA